MVDEDIFATLSRHAESMNPTETAKKPTTEEALTGILGVLEKMNNRLDSVETRQSSPVVVQQSPPPIVSQVKPEDMRVSMDGLPDPITDPEKYQSELVKRMNSALDARTQALRAESTSLADQQQRSQTLYSAFIGRHEGWMEHEDLVGLSAKRVADLWKARGGDPVGDPDRFADEVASDLAKRYPKLAPTLSTDADTEEGEEDDEDDGRTGGIFGGIEQGRAPSSGKRAESGDMLADLRAIQMKSGYF